MSEAERSRRTRSGTALLPIALVVFAGVFGVISARSDAARAQDGSSGAALYAASCAGCHQPGGEGLPGTFPPLAGNPAAADPDYVATVITEGKSGPIDVLGVHYDGVMPPFGNLTADEVVALTDHVVGLATGAGSAPSGTTPEAGTDETAPTTLPPTAPTAGDPDRGRDLFVGSDALAAGGTACASCHTAGDVRMAGGNGLGPDLTDVYGRFGGEAGVAAWLANPASPTMTPIFADRALTEEETADLVAFLADAAERDRPNDAVDWLAIAGGLGAAALLGVMALAFRGRRRPYSHQLAARAATSRSQS